MCSWLPLRQITCGWVRKRWTRPAEFGPRSIMSPKHTTLSSALRFSRCRSALKVARCPWISPSTKIRWPSSRRACRRLRARAVATSKGRFNLQLKLFTEEMVPSVSVV